MEAAKSQLPNYLADILVLDQEGQVALLVEVKASKLQDRAKQIAILNLSSYLHNATREIRFAMLADLVKIEVFKCNGDNISEPIISLKTAEILSYYDAEFSDKRILASYLETLVEAWLRDLAYHWKLATPPGSKELAEIGLLQRLEKGTTHAQVNLFGDTLH